MARENRARRHDCCPLRRRSRRRIAAPGGRRTVSERFSGAVSEVWAGGSSGENAADRVRALCGVCSTEARAGKAGNIHVPRVHALLWHELIFFFKQKTAY